MCNECVLVFYLLVAMCSVMVRASFKPVAYSFYSALMLRER